jgi:hypothetical protein
MSRRKPATKSINAGTVFSASFAAMSGVLPAADKNQNPLAINPKKPENCHCLSLRGAERQSNLRDCEQ